MRAVTLALVLALAGCGSASSPTAPTVPAQPLWSKAGVGVTVFDMPLTVRRVKITGAYADRCQNFIVHIAGRSVVSEILGTCDVATSGSHFEGTVLTTGGVTEILNASGVEWSFEEVR
jgi:hypothetical protein